MTLSDMLNFALVVAMISLLGFFSEELMRFLERHFSNFWIKLLLPLFLASLLVMHEFAWLANWVYLLQFEWNAFAFWLVGRLPLEKNAYSAAVFVMGLSMAMLPQMIIYLQNRKKRPTSRLNYWLPRVGIVCWLTTMMFYWVMV